MITLLLSISLAYAEELSLNYQEALDLALDQNPQIQDAKWSIDGAEARRHVPKHSLTPR